MNDGSEKTTPMTVNGQRHGAVTRRETIQWVMTAVAASTVPAARGFAQVPGAPKEEGRNVISQEPAAQVPDPTFKDGYGTDPKLVKTYKPGEVWPLTMTDAEKRTARALADTMLPADQYGPAASDVGVVEMLDEWVSAPYPEQQRDRPLILTGLDWTEQESAKRFKKPFDQVTDAQRQAICDDICIASRAQGRFRGPARFFGRFRAICAGAYYATPAGWTAIGYVGNVALERFDGPPPQVLEKLGVA